MDGERCVRHEEEMHRLEIEMTQVRGDVTHIKDKIDNGLSTTVDKIWMKLNDDISPKVNDNTYWISKGKAAIALVLIFGVVRLAWDHLGTFIGG